jgi:N-acetylglucosaminyl-diphospho-decaprenol L-rhamnosyltransferase
MDLSIIIVNWNVRDLLADCLRSIEQYHGGLQVETIIVDSASTDGSLEMLRRDFPWVKLIACEENIGFVRGNNLGLAQAQGRHLLLLNPDTKVHVYALQKMVDYLDHHPQVGIIGPHTLNTDGTIQSTRRRFHTLMTGIFESGGMEWLAPPGLLHHFMVQDLPDDGTFEVDWVQGSALMARRTVYEQIGGLDADYIMFFEEVDWCKRATLKGWQVVYMGDAYITHHGGKSTDQVVTRRHIHFQHSKLRYFRRYHGLLPALIVRLVLIISYGMQLLSDAAKGFVGHKVELRQERVKSYAAVLRSLITNREIV